MSDQKHFDMLGLGAGGAELTARCPGTSPTRTVIPLSVPAATGTLCVSGPCKRAAGIMWRIWNQARCIGRFLWTGLSRSRVLLLTAVT